MPLLYISFGAVFGACSRWGLGILLNPFFNSLAFGTLIANYLGCFLMGIILMLFSQYPAINPEWRHFLITGFLGSLTTFSAFSGEVIENLLYQRYLPAIGIASLHLFGCLLCTILGVLLWKVLF
ncbi:fluoride ion transporter CrcB [Mergibacter septicus]|uniref:Fluoride-specific ion channel FluC n=1 Tax=Mergibacter septicus TaxID=221402 RepID=A0A8E3MGK7_9PAST|nr:fluoride efflux transporter CrcB [Mergibacter septicus]AWX15534.1 fluoride ion transporter CrcB [Mergibacter septicus]QDJ13015.1 fluoride ion transporter CrcB [Mergibacter septicus]QDJ14788.1 fluoride ion transporter CrcB [Mergibacter septicus]UTU47782.1 fluoride efflux transporter CrcB [Mergibacter septicus]WMR96609.1 fluoride efflux transporter CrcB [Mergibacter septicus]